MLVIGVSGRPLRGRWLRECGATSAELAGVIVAAVCLVMALILPATGWGEKLTCLVNSAISQVGGGPALDCSSKEQGIDDPKAHAPTEPCVQSSRKQSAGGGVSVVVSAEVNGGIIVEQLSDGTYRVTRHDGNKAALGGGEAIGGKVNWGDHHYGVYAGASADAGIVAGAGTTYVVNSAEEKDRLVAHLTRHMAVDAASGVANVGQMNLGTLIGGGVNWLGDKVSSYSPPKPSEQYFELGTEGNASASMVGGWTSAEVKGTAAHALGGKINYDKGTVTTYYKYSLGAGTAADDAVNGGRGKAEGGAEMLLEVTTSVKDGSLVGLSTTGAANGEWAAALPSSEGSGSKGGVVYSAALDTSTPQGRQAAQNMLSSLGVPVPGHSSSVPVSQAFQDLVHEAESQGGITSRRMVRDSAEYGFDFEVKYLLEAGLSAKYTDEAVTYSDGQYLYKGKWYKWEGC